jgi:hypothetical protein
MQEGKSEALSALDNDPLTVTEVGAKPGFHRSYERAEALVILSEPQLRVPLHPRCNCRAGPAEC